MDKITAEILAYEVGFYEEGIPEALISRIFKAESSGMGRG